MPLSRRYGLLGVVVFATVLTGAIYLGTSVRNQEGADVKAGRQFAERQCARCHAVGTTGASPIDAAPPFRGFAKLWPLESIEEALAEGIDMEHHTRPVFRLTPRQIKDFMGYLETIQR